MNPRIYKKQAKRAVELLRSHGDTTKYTPSSEPVFRSLYPPPADETEAMEAM